MTDATGETVTLRLDVAAADGRVGTFSTSGTVITHQGFLSVYSVSKEENAEEDEVKEQLLPPLSEGDSATLTTSEPSGHDTQPPARFTEASLIKKLEELGVGRPSTYASIMGTIQDRGYARKKGSALVPTFLAFAVITLLEQHFPDLVDYAFTAQMEEDLDSIAGGDAEAIPYLSRFYFGAVSSAQANENGLKSKVETRLGEIDARAVNSIPLGADSDGVLIVARVGKFGPYLERGEDRASVPEDIAPDELTIDKAIELLDAPKSDRVLGVHPETGLDVELKAGRFGPYVQMGAHDDETDEKPKTGSLFSTMSPETITFEEALKLLSLPRVIGNHPEDGVEITAQNGRYGPYIKKGTDSRTIESEDLIFTMELDQAVQIFAQPKRRGTAKPPLREMGVDPATELSVVMKEGRFGVYVTDGESNASLRKGDDPDEITIERASELLAERRAAGPTKKKKKAKKKATKKKATAKKKAPAKKAAKKKTAAKKKPAADSADD
jgi:DNA topoisomerase-1